MCEWQRFRKYQRSNSEEGRFPIYINAVKRSFARHEFTRPFELNEDLERQGKLTTWIEFVDYEYWLYKKGMRFVKRHQPQYDEAWKKLVDSKILRPFETEEFICNIASAFRHASEREQAEKAVKSAKADVMSAEKAITGPGRSSLSHREPREGVAAAQSRLDSAIKILESIKRRNDLVYEFIKAIGQPQIVKGKLKKSYREIKKKCRAP